MKHFQLLTLSATVLLMACCVDEEETTYDAVGVASSATRAEITIPLTGTTTDTEGDTTTVDERRVDNLWLYAYKYSGDGYTLTKARYLDITNITSTPDTTITAEGDTTILNYTITTATDGASDTTLTVTTDLDAGMYLLYVVGNAGEIEGETDEDGTSTTLLQGTETQSALEAITVTKDQLLSEADDESGAGLVMAVKKQDVYVANGETNSVDAALTFASAKVDFTVTFDPADDDHLYDDEGNLTSLTNYFGGAPTLTVDSVRIENISTKSTLVVASATDAFLTDTISVKLYDSSSTEESTEEETEEESKSTLSTFNFQLSTEDNKVIISGSGYVPERYVSDATNQTRLRIYGKMTMATGELYENEVYTLVIGGDATGSTLTKADERDNLGTLARGNYYTIKAWMGYQNETYLRVTVTAQAFKEVEEEELTTDD